MANEALVVPKTPQIDPDAQLYRHVKRPEWGVAVLAWERGNTRGYQFEDGRLRKIREGYYKLLRPVEDFEGPEDVVRANLGRALSATGGKAKRSVEKAVATFEEQMDLFVKLYPEGFEDPAWVSDHRGGTGRNALKRHRQPALEKAQELLSRERCESAIAEARHDDLVEAVADLLGGTSLVPVAHVKQLRRLGSDERVRYAEAVTELLHGERHFTERFADYLETLASLLGGRPSWRVATVLPALMFPDEHVAVRRSAFVRQAGSIAPTAKYSRRARVGSYKNFRRVAVGVRKRLVAAGREPRDMLDVHDFIWATLRSSALEHLGSDS